MMQNPALHYHQLSIYERSKMDFHALDWEYEPSVYKEYPGGEVFLVSAIFFRSSWKYRDRGYRDVMLAAGRLGQRLYLGAAALELGCCAVGAFYDREAVEVLELPESANLLYLLAVGPVKK